MATLNASALEPTDLEIVEKVLKKHFEESTTVTKKVAKGGPINTRGIRVSVYTTGNSSFNWFGEAGSYATPLGTEDIETKVYPVRCSAGYEFSGTFLRQGKQEGNLVKGVTDYRTRSQASALKKFEQQFCATQTGELGVVLTRDSVTQVTFASTYAAGSMFGGRKLTKNSRIAWYSSAGAQRTGTDTLSIVATPGGTAVTFDTVPTDVAATDIAVHGDPTTAGSYNKAMTGLQDFVSASGVIQGRSRSVDVQLKAYTEDAGGAAITATRLRKVTDALQYRSDDVGKHTILSAPCQMSMFERQFLNRIRYDSNQKGAKDEVKPAFGEFMWEKSVDIHDDRIYILDFSAYKRHDLKPWGDYNEDGSGNPWRLYFSNGAASDKFTGWVGWEGNYSCNQFNTQILIYNNSAPTDAALGYASFL
jgi:hypothetical protein